MKPHAIDVYLAVTLLAVFLFFAHRLKAQSRAVDEPMAKVQPLNNDALLKMIAEVESWDGESVGAAGEAGPCQVKPSTWYDYSREPFPYSGAKWRGPEAQRMLHAHAEFIRDEMERHHLPQTAFTFALCWKAGVGHVLRNTVKRADKEYSERAENLYRELIK